MSDGIRSARCVAETGGGEGITVGPNFDAAFADPENGKLAFAIEPHADVDECKSRLDPGLFRSVRAGPGHRVCSGALRNAAVK